MPSIIELKRIKSIAQEIDLITAMKKGFIEYSNGNSVVPPVGELLFDKPPGDVHIKYGYIKNQKYYVIKIASGFYENEKLDIPSGQGLMLLFKQETGQLEAILLDEGYLTNIRTVAAGALAVKHFGRNKKKIVGIIGSGTIAKLQIEFLQANDLCHNFYLWGRNHAKAAQLQSELRSSHEVQVVSSCTELAKRSDIIITTTPSAEPLLRSSDILPGTLIVAIGSDTEHKQELDSAILSKADIVIADSIPQSKSRGEIYRAIKDTAINENKVIEFGKALQDDPMSEHSTDVITVVDLTGVAVQDIMVASTVYAKYLKQG